MSTPTSRNQKVYLQELERAGVTLYLKREDEIHPHISGNKYRKLKFNLQEAKKQGAQTLLTFGGAFSNHIAALSYAGSAHNFKTIGVIRGDELANQDVIVDKNPTLNFARKQGMQLEFMSREMYRRKDELEIQDLLRAKFGKFYLVPEGGTNPLAIVGCEEILGKEDEVFDYICAPVGTGGTIAGLINSSASHQKILGFSSLKGDFLEAEIKKMVKPGKNWSLINEYHFGGYAKINEKLISFINEFYQSTTIPLDPIYTGKMIYGLLDLIKNQNFKNNSKILAIHTGGLQGIAGMNQKLKKKKMPLLCVGNLV